MHSTIAPSGKILFFSISSGDTSNYKYLFIVAPMKITEAHLIRSCAGAAAPLITVLPTFFPSSCRAVSRSGNKKSKFACTHVCGARGSSHCHTIHSTHAGNRRRRSIAIYIYIYTHIRKFTDIYISQFHFSRRRSADGTVFQLVDI